MTDPFDPTTDEDDVLAVSAVLDGTASAVEAARVESTPSLQALLSDLRALRAEIVDVPPVSASTREAAIASALAVFDDLHALPTAPAETAPAATAAPSARTPMTTPRAADTVMRFERRRRWYGVVTGAAAAAVAVLFVGALLSGGLGGGDDEDNSAIDAVAGEGEMREASEKTMAPAEAFSTEIATAEAAPAATESPVGGAPMTEATEAASFPDSDGDIAATATTAASGDTVDVVDGPAEVVIAISSPEQLRDYARDRPAVLPLPGLGLPCVGEGFEPIGEVSYQGIQVIVVRDPSTGTITAYDLRGSCAVVAVAEP